MTDQPKRLMSKKYVITMCAAVTAFVGVRMVVDHQTEGTPLLDDLVITVLTLLMLYGIIGFVYWWANRPDRG